MNKAVQETVDRVEETYFTTPPENMSDLEHQMWGDIALLTGVIKGMDAAQKITNAQ